MEGVENFEVLDLVAWNIDDEVLLPLIAGMIEKYGKRPFTVLEIEDIPANLCACGLSENHPNHDFHLFEDQVCTQTMREIAGHHQRVRIMGPSADMVAIPDSVAPGSRKQL